MDEGEHGRRRQRRRSAGTVYGQLVTDDAGLRHQHVGHAPGHDADDLEPETVPAFFANSVCLYTVSPATGTAVVIGATNVFETPVLRPGLVRWPHQTPGLHR